MYKVSEAVQRGPKTPQWQHTTCQPKLTTMMTSTRDTQPRNGARGPHNPSRGITLHVQGKYSGPGGPKNPNQQHTTMMTSTRDTQPRNDARGPHNPSQGITLRVQGKYSGPGGPKNPNRQHTMMTASTRDTQP